MRKVLLVAFDMSPSLGSEAGVAYLWKTILAEKYSIDVYTDAIHKESILRNGTTNGNVRYYFINNMKPWRRFGRKTGLRNIASRIFYWKVKKELSHLHIEEYSLIHCITPAGIHSYNDLYKLGVPVIVGPLGGGLSTPSGFPEIFGCFSLNTTMRELFYKFHVKGFAWKRYINRAEKVIVGTPIVEEKIPEDSRNKCVTIFDSVIDTDVYFPKEENDSRGKIVILFSGRLVPLKGVTLLVKAAEKLLKEKGVNNFLIKIAGDGPMYKEINSSIQDRGLSDYVSLLGHVLRTQMVEIYQGADIYCLPTLRENGGTAVLEAMSCGLPIITSNYGGPSFSVSNECGIKIDVRNDAQYVDDLVEALCRLIDDDHLRRNMGNSARQRVIGEYSTHALKGKIHSLYEGLIN